MALFRHVTVIAHQDMNGMAETAGLLARGVGVHFEGLVALDGVDLHLARGEILGLIGPNGAGKTTLVNVLTGFQQPDKGAVLVDGKDCTGLPAHSFARTGVLRTFQAARLFPDFTVRENVELAALTTGQTRSQASALAEEQLDLLGLGARADVRAATLSYGEARLAGIARALAGRPRYLLLDEPAAGLSPREATDLVHSISAIRDRAGCGILVIEHNMKLIMDVCDRVTVLARGLIIATDTPQQVQKDEQVRLSYLGEPDTSRSGRVRRPAQAGSVKKPSEVDMTSQTGSDTAPLLKIDDLSVRYGQVRALEKASLSVPAGGFVSVIGPNGAGKSTLMAAIAGLVAAASGTIVFDGRRLDTGVPVERRVAEGIALVPEGRRILSNLTVEENLRVGATLKRHTPQHAERLESVLARFPILRERFRGYAGKLSGGEQQQLAIARALLAAPRLILLDEPSLGLAPLMIDAVYQTLDALHADGLSILLVEQNASRALAASDYAYVIRNGSVELEGNAANLASDPAFERAYFGFSSHRQAAAASVGAVAP